MFVELTAPGLGFPVGEIVDVADGIGRAYVEAGQAKPSDAMSAMRASLRSMLSERDAALQSKLEEVKAASRSAPSPPPHREGLEFEGGVTPGEAAADRGKKSTTDLFRCIGIEGVARDPKAAEWARTRLEKSYGLRRSLWEEGVGRDGTESLSTQTYGYLVPPQWIPDVFQVMSEQSVMTGLNTINVGSSVEVRRPALDQYLTPGSKTSAMFGGVTLYRAGESATRTTSDAVLDEIIFKVTDLTGMTKVSRDLLADSMVNLDSFLGDLFGRAFAWRVDYDYILGSGAGEPLGFRGGTQSALATVTRNTASHIYYADLAGMLAKIHPSCYSGLRWIASPSTLADLASVQTSSSAFAYQPNSVITQSMLPSAMPNNMNAGLLMGYPLYLTEKVPPLGTAGDINLVCTRMYGEVIRSGVEIAVSEHRYFETDQIAYRWKMRHDGRPLWRSTIKAADGANTAYAPFAAIG